MTEMAQDLVDPHGAKRAQLSLVPQGAAPRTQPARSCATCIFFDTWSIPVPATASREIEGECHCMPPLMVTPSGPARMHGRVAEFPVVSGGDWCGEHKPQEASP